MGDFEFGYRPKPIRLLDQQLTLDPEIQRMIADIEARSAANRILPAMQRPDFRLLLPDFESLAAAKPPNIFTAQPPAAPPSVWSSTPGAGPAKPRAGELADVTGAVYKLPVVQGLVKQAHDEGMRQLRVLKTEWGQSSTGSKIAMVSTTGVVVGSFITVIVANKETRDLAFGLIKDRDIPVPGVDGLSFKILDRGGAVKTPLGIPGLTGGVRLQFPNSAAPNYEVNINFDVMQFLRSKP